MAQAHFPFSRAVKGADRRKLLDSQRAWNKSVPSECKLSSLPASPAVVSCLMRKYEDRASALDACSTGLDIGCVTSNTTSGQP